MDVPGRYVGPGRAAAGRRHAVPDGLGHQDVHRGAGHAVPRRRAARPGRPDRRHLSVPGARRADHPAAAVAHLRASSGSRTATCGTRCGCRTREQLLADLARAERVLPPARRFHYSNLGLALLGQLVAPAARRRPGPRCWPTGSSTRWGCPMWSPIRATGPRSGYLVDAYSDHARPEPPIDFGAVGAGRPAVVHRGGPGPVGRVPGRSRPGGPRRRGAGSESTLDEMRWPLTVDRRDALARRLRARA